MKSAQGFTLIELLIVVGIISLISGALIPGFSNYIKNQNIRQAQEQIKSDLRSIQNKALTEATSGAAVTYWGVRIAANNAPSYTYFTSSAASPTSSECTSNQGTSEILPGSVLIKSNAPPVCVFFSVSNGGVTFMRNGSTVACNSVNDCKIAVGYTSTTTNCSAVGLNEAGLIQVISGFVPCT